MLRATLDQMRASAGRLTAAAIAILLGTAFVAASLLASATMERATHDAFTASYGDADLVVDAQGVPIGPEEVAAVRGTDGVATADVQSWFGLEVTGPRATEWVSFSPTPSDPRLAVGTLSSGRDATAADEIVLAADVAERLGVEIGDVVPVGFQVYDEATDTQEQRTDRLEVVGLLEASDNFFAMGAGGRLEPEALDAWRTEQNGGDPEFYGTVLVALADGADLESVRADLQSAPGLADASVQTVPELAAERTARETGSNVTFLVVMLGFAAVALSVAGLVISNTFQVLVAQRTRTLALLRCVGASRGQIRRSVLLEASLVGLLSSLAGLALGTGVVMIGVRVLDGAFTSSTIGTTVPFGWAVPVVTIGVGVLVTLLSALVPARMATRVAPVAALRPVEGPSEQGAGRRRMTLTVAATLIGALMLAGGVALSLGLSDTDTADAAMLGGLAIGVLGGLISLTGILVGSVFLVPRLLPLLGRLAGKGVPARIATANAVRNPRRTAATTNALVIGVALVVMMSTGAYSARHTLMDELDSSFPVDVVAQVGDTSVGITPEQVEAVRQTEGIAATATLRTQSVEIGTGDLTTYVYLMAVDSGDLGDVMRSDALDGLTDGVMVIGWTYELGNLDGETVTVTGTDGTTLDLRTVRGDVGQNTAYVTPEAAETLVPDAQVTTIYARMADDTDAVATAGAVQKAVNEVTEADGSAPVLQVGGAAVERAAYGQVIDTLLAVVLGLLAVAVVIALVGVANTLSLSVLERRRENATLRAMGLTRGQLRGMLAVEGVLIASVGALVGGVAGLLYGWAGAAVVLGGLGSLSLGVPWPQLAAVVVIALAAGLVASVLPARSAVRQSPVAALATD
ncbi:MAG TPA: FtsX-like permease family protein [Actinotalea caeni]|uniref:ABC transporter permease n=1 Tax=Actinotalea caeni TaxID=1348467 RepID=UPI002B4AF219|nr:FtsX-like permease family protein [Actinotalea caeni]HLV54327.1 FtsX-like permease family protein [Actinotalea caeni]